jgi:hypothetical protein
MTPSPLTLPGYWQTIIFAVVGAVLATPLATAVLLFIRQRLTYKKNTISEVLERSSVALQRYRERYPGQKSFKTPSDIAASYVETFFSSIDYFAALLLNFMVIALGVLLMAGIVNGNRIMGLVGWTGKQVQIYQYLCLSLVAFTSAHFSNLYEAIKRSRNTDLPPSALHVMWIRLLFALYVGPIFANQLKVSFSVAVGLSLGIGLLPLPSILEFAKQTISKLSSQAVAQSDKTADIGRLQGADATVVDGLLEADVTNVVQLAYSDPFTLLVKTGMSWTFLIDLIDQALLYIYLREDTPKVFAAGVRGAIEMATVGAQLASSNPDERRAGKQSLTTMASALGSAESQVLDLIRTLYADSQVNLIWDLFVGDPPLRPKTIPALE